MEEAHVLSLNKRPHGKRKAASYLYFIFSSISPVKLLHLFLTFLTVSLSIFMLWFGSSSKCFPHPPGGKKIVLICWRVRIGSIILRSNCVLVTEVRMYSSDCQHATKSYKKAKREVTSSMSGLCFLALMPLALQSGPVPISEHGRSS